ncbi:HET-domain-containing protein [Apiospora arundinis]
MQSCSVRAKDIDYNAVRSLIAQCDHEHQAICGVSAKLWTKPLQHFYLIHCESRRIISVHEPCDYVALSYVWGKPVNILGISDTQSTFPQTIKDAIKVTTQLEFSYLWVDRYCINQSSEVHKTTQIQQMGQIYSQATLTIIAAAGVNPSYGLPGVSRERIRLPCDVVIGAYRVTPVPDSPKSYIQNSVWATRGWTYQEAYLSRRLLFFTDSQLLFECRGAAMKSSNLAKCYAETCTRHRKGGQTLKALVDNIDDFSSRELRFVQDRLRAFLGVLAHFSAAPVPIYHIWGVPLVFIRSRDKWELFLHTWEATQSDRNPGYPSWSWLGWTGRISAKNVLDYAFNDYYSVKVEEKNQVVDLSPTLLQQYYSVGNSPEAAPAVLQLESTVFPIYAVKHVQPNPGRKLMELIYDMERGSFGLVYGYQDLDVIPEMVNEPSWVTWQGRNGKWVYSKYTVLDRTFPGNLTGNEKTKLLAVNIGGRSIFSEVGILRAVGGGYETVGFISLFKGSTILIEVGDGEVPQNKSVDCWAPRMTPDKVRWL